MGGREENRMVEEALAAGSPIIDELFGIQGRLARELFGTPPNYNNRTDLLGDSRLDALQALEILDPEDGSLPRARGLALEAVGRHAEAAQAFLLAAERLDNEYLRGDGSTGDENDWANWSRFRAAKQFAIQGRRLAARSVLQKKLDVDDRAEIERMLASTSDE
jgi:tetratricopeptide (TPR) repeat protein